MLWDRINLFASPVMFTSIDLSKIEIESAAPTQKKWFSRTPTTHGQNNKLKPETEKYLKDNFMLALSPIFGQPSFSKHTLDITDVWINDYQVGDYQESHIHAGVHFSFIIYLNGESQTVFTSPLSNTIQSFYGNLRMFQTNFVTKIEPGGCVLFPSYLEHFVTAHNKPKKTLSGNIKVVLNR